jgi:DHA2 family multidrug resistance protein
LRVLGGSFSASITTFLWDHRAVIHHAQLNENINVYNPTAVEALKQYGETTEIAAYNINNLINQQALQISFNEVFWGLGWLFVLLVGLVWLAKPPFMAKPGAASGAH